MSTLFLGDCLDVMRKMDEDSIDAIVTDPPYGLAFMGKDWDFGVPGEAFWREALRVAKPGAHLLAFGGTRTYHRLACAIEDAGWEIRDCIMWVYGSGFPKSMDVSKAIDKMRGAEREVVGKRPPNVISKKWREAEGRTDLPTSILDITAPSTPEAAAWNGWGTCLKPAVEPIVVARKPLDGTVAANVLKYGTGAINIDGCRVGKEKMINPPASNNRSPSEKGVVDFRMKASVAPTEAIGRFPANLIHDGSDEVLALFPDTGKSTGGRTIKRSGGGNVGSGKKSEASWSNDDPGFGDSGSAARFFYCAKASRSERGEGNVHPTVKPIALMRYLVRLVTRKGGRILDPFMGSGTTGIAAVQEGMRFVGIEKDEHYYEIAQSRVCAAKPITSTTQQELPL